MNSSTYSVPTAERPKRPSQFLCSGEHLYDYEHLFGFADWLSDQPEMQGVSDENPLILHAPSSDELIFLVAACFLLKKPVLPVSHDVTKTELGYLLNNIQPGCIYSKSPDLFKKSSGKILQIPKEALQKPGKWNSSKFSISEPDALLGIFLTSGTTGKPKLVPLTRRQLLFASAASAKNFKPDVDSYWLLCLPMSHIGGISIIYRSILYGSAVYRMDQFDEEQVRLFLSENRLFQAASLVPTMLTRLMDDPLFQVHKSFKAVLLGGGPVTLQLIEKAVMRGIPIVSSYGMTETCALIAANSMLKPNPVYHPKKSVGTLFSPNEIDIRDEDRRSLPLNETGFIWLKGPQVFDGYLDPDETQKKFDQNNWFNTGDFGYINKFGQLFIKTKRTDLIITGGKNVDPVEVEHALLDLDWVTDAAVLGIEDKEWGQKIVALLKTRSNDERNKSSIKNTLKKVLSSYKIPKEFILTDAIPRTPTGKIKRGLLTGIYRKFRKNKLL